LLFLAKALSAHAKLAHRRGGQYSEFTEFFGGNVEFGAAVNEIAFAPTIKNTPVVSGDRRPTRRGSFRAGVENAIVSLLPHGDTKLPAVARRLGLSQRTLPRRLAAENLNFSDVEASSSREFCLPAIPLPRRQS
jgi:hypothetical protein